MDDLFAQLDAALPAREAAFAAIQDAEENNAALIMAPQVADNAEAQVTSTKTYVVAIIRLVTVTTWRRQCKLDKNKNVLLIF
jgi:hypothetical protein